MEEDELEEIEIHLPTDEELPEDILETISLDDHPNILPHSSDAQQITSNIKISKEDEIVIEAPVKESHLTKIIRFGRNWSSVLSFFMGLGYIFAGAFIFWMIERGDNDSEVEGNGMIYTFAKPWTLENSIYFCIVSLATIGFGDIAPITNIGRCFFIVYITFGLVVIAFAVSGISTSILSMVAFARLRFQMLAFYIHRNVKRCFFSPVLEDTNNDNNIEMDDLSSSPKPKLKKKRSKISRFIHFISFQTIRFFLSPQSTFGIATTFLFGLLFLCAFVFMWVEDRTYIESFFFCFTTMTTIGFGDLVPITRAGKAVVCCFSLLALGMITVLIGEISAIISYTATKRIEKEKEQLIIARLDDKVPWGVSDMLTHLKLRSLQLSLSPTDLHHLIEKLKEEMDEYYDEFCHDLARPLHDLEEEKDALKREEEKREKHLSRVILNNNTNRKVL